MAVRGSTKRERLRAADGSRPALPGGMDPTGLVALAVVSSADGADPSSPAALTGAARAALYTEPVEPCAAATLLVQSSRDIPGARLWSDASSFDGWTMRYRPMPGGDGFNYAARRGDTAPFGAFMLGRSRMDDPRVQLAPSEDGGHPDLPAAPWVFTPATPLARAIPNAEASPSVTAWAAVGAATDENLCLNPSFATSAARWDASSMGATLTRQTGGGEDGGAYARVAVTGATGRLSLSSRPSGPVQPGEPVSARAAVRGTPGVAVRLIVARTVILDNGASSTTPFAETTAVLTSSWQEVKVEGAVFPGPKVSGVSAWIDAVDFERPTGDVLEVDRVKVRRAATVGSYVDGASSGGAWSGATHLSASVIAPTSGTYGRPADALAPTLTLAGTNVHRRTGALSAGARLRSPLGVMRYATPAGREFTAAGWVRVTTDAGSGMVTLRWVAELSSESYGDIVVMRGEPFNVTPNAPYRRAASLLTAPGTTATLSDAARTGGAGAVRLSLEVVQGPAVDSSASTLSIRGAHFYAGVDRGDLAGLDAVPLNAHAAFSVDSPESLGFPANRVDVHGHDPLSTITAGTVTVLYAGNAPDGGPLLRRASGASPGRLTIRVADVGDTWAMTSATVRVEEVSGGPGAPLGMQNVVVWRELDVSDDLVELGVERSADADPSDSSVPVGNYAAATARVVLDDPDGRYSVFRQSYVTTGHRLELAAGVTYTNRHPDPGAVEASTFDAPPPGWPRVGAVVSFVEPDPDRFGQVPPAPFMARSTGTTGVVSAACPAAEGVTMRGRVWVRTSGATPRVLWGGARVSEGTAGATYVRHASTSIVPGPGLTDAWWLVHLPPVVVPAGQTHVVVSVDTPAGSTMDARMAAPVLERVDAATGAVVEVAETTPVGVFYTTAWDDDAASHRVNVAAVDVLGLRAADDLRDPVRADTNTTYDLHRVARRSLGLGSDQVLIEPVGTPLRYVVPAQDVGTQVADLAKAANVTAHTDGAGRLVARLTQDTPDLDDATVYGPARVVDASVAVTPDAVRNDVSVTVHPATFGEATQVAVVGREDPLVFPMTWRGPRPQDIIVPPGGTVRLEVPHDPAGGMTWAGSWVDGSIPSGSMLTAAWTLVDWPGSVTFEELADRTLVTLTAWEVLTAPVYLLRLVGTGEPLNVGDLTIRDTAEQSVQRFGRRPVEVDVRLAQTAAAGQAVAADVLRNFALITESGDRRIPDLEVDALFDPWRELGDRVVVRTLNGPSGNYRVLRHTIDVGVGGRSGLYVRAIDDGFAVFIVGRSALNGGARLSY